MFPSPAMKITIWRPMAQKDMKMKAGLASWGSKSQRWGAMPTQPRASFRMPYSGWKTRCQTTALATSGTMMGR